MDYITLIFLNTTINYSQSEKIFYSQNGRNNFTVLYILIPIELWIAQCCPRKWRFLDQLGLYAVIACYAMPRATLADDYSFGTSMPVLKKIYK